MTRTFPESPFDREAVVDEWGFETHDEHHVQVLGVDLNVNGSTAVTSAAGFYGNADSLNHRREHYERVRAGLQETGTRSAHLTIQEFSGREARWVDEYAHSVSNCIVWDALRTGSTHVAFEDLSYIRADIANAKKFQQWLFARIYEYVKYKLVPFGVQVEQIDPENTSKACSYTECGHIAETNRCRKLFECDECLLMLNADYNAARNIGLCLAEEHDQSGRTRSAGRATSQLALKSGTLTPDGGFESHDWVSTDKPTASVVGS